MVMRRFRVPRQVTLDSTGYGEASIGPGTDTWQVELVTCSTSTNVSEPTFRLYADTVSPVNLLEGSYSGSQDSSDSVHIVAPGQALIGTWTGGDPGAVATLLLSGSVVA